MVENCFQKLYQELPRPKSFMPGAVAPWANLLPEDRKVNVVELKDRVQDSYAKQSRLQSLSETAIVPESAVLVPLKINDVTREVDEIVFIKRPDTMRNYSGHVAFPGGHKDESDESYEDCAMRETFEEIGIASQDIEIICRSKFAQTKTENVYIAPILGILSTSAMSNMVLSKDEVETVHIVKMQELLAPDNYYCEIWDRPNVSHNIHIFTVTDIEGRPVFIWGASAQILFDILSANF